VQRDKLGRSRSNTLNKPSNKSQGPILTISYKYPFLKVLGKQETLNDTRTNRAGSSTNVCETKMDREEKDSKKNWTQHIDYGVVDIPDDGDKEVFFSFRKLLAFAGPGWLMSIAYLDPGIYDRYYDVNNGCR